jgi:hypothetical protein
MSESELVLRLSWVAASIFELSNRKFLLSATTKLLACVTAGLVRSTKQLLDLACHH